MDPGTSFASAGRVEWHPPLACAFALCLIGALLAAPGASAGEVFKWVDENGRTHYGDRPPGEVEGAVPLSLPPTADRDADWESREALRRRLLEAFEEEREAARLAAAESERAAAERRQKCERAKRNLAEYERSQLLYTVNPDGTRVYLGEEDRTRVLANARKLVREWCR